MRAGRNRPCPAIESVFVRRILALLLPFLLLVTACSQGSSDPAASDSAPSASVSVPPSNPELLKSVKVEEQGAGKAPTVTFDKPLTLDEVAIRRVTEGTGAEVTANQTATIRIQRFNAETGDSIVENFTAATGESVAFNDQLKQYNPLVYNAFVGAKVGAFIAYGIPAQPAVPASASSAAQDAQPAAVEIYQIESAKDEVKPLAGPEGDTVSPPAGLPTVKDDAKGTPVITIGDAKAPTELISQNLIEGKGPVLKSSDTIIANYVGVNFVGGDIFDSSFERGEPATFPLTGVIKGWTQGLTGKTVGSRVLLVIPKDLAYGDAGQGKAKGDLVFVVDILGVQ